MSTSDYTTIVNSAPVGTYTRASAPSDPSRLPIEEFFGPPFNRLAVNPYDKAGISAMNLAQAYQGDNLVLTNRITGYIADKKHGFYTTMLLPLYNVSQLRWNFSTQRANPALAGLVPYEGTSRMLTSTIRTFQGQTERRGIEIKVEGDFYLSAGGKLDYAHKIQHIKDTVQRTMDYQVVVCIDQCQDYFLTWAREHPIMFKQRPTMLMDWETNFFGCIHRY